MKKYIKYIIAFLFALAFMIDGKVKGQSIEKYFAGGAHHYYERYRDFIFENGFGSKYSKRYDAFFSVAYAVIQPVTSDTLNYTVFGEIRGTRFTLNDSSGIYNLVTDFIKLIKPDLIVSKENNRLPILIPFVICRDKEDTADSLGVLQKNYPNNKGIGNLPFGEYFVFQPLPFRTAVGHYD